MMFIKLKRLLIALMAFTMTLDVTQSAPKSWPYMKTYDIWDTNNKVDTHRHQPKLERDNLIKVVENNATDIVTKSERKAKGESLVVTAK
jgi:hypothetical protein